MATSTMSAILPHISLMQATTEEETESDVIVTLRTPQERLLSPEVTETDYDTTDIDETEGEMSSDSSDWDSLSDDMNNNPCLGHSRTGSLASSYLPRNHKKQNPHSHINSLTSPNNLPSLIEQERDDNIYDENANLDYTDTLFYPFPNFQSLLFSQHHPFTVNDYKIIDTNNNSYDSDDEESNSDDIINMDWYDNISVNKFKQLLSQLLITASFGIREDEIYLMFSSPTPQEIIQHLRFGVLRHLCTIHIDRFGRRSFYYDCNYENSENSHFRFHTKSHFYNHEKLPSDLDHLVMNDDNLTSFIEETPSPISLNNNLSNFSPVVESPLSMHSPIDIDNDMNMQEIIPPLPPASPINTSWEPIQIAKPLKMGKKTSNGFPIHLLTKKLPSLHNTISGSSQHSNHSNHPKFTMNLSNASNHSASSVHSNPYANINYANTYLYTKTHMHREYSGNAPNIGSIIDKINAYEGKHKKNIKSKPSKPKLKNKKSHPKPIHINAISKFKRNFSKKRSPNKRLPPMPKPKVRDSVKQKIKHRKNTAKELKEYKANKRGMKLSVMEFKSMSLLSIIAGIESHNNYLIAKTIAKYFDMVFNDTDTVVICSGIHKEPSVSYWLKGKGEYVRRSTNVLIGMYQKTITIYRACHHINAKLPVVSQKQFEMFVRNICEKHKNKSVGFVGDLLDKQFGLGVHFARSTLKRCDYDIFCRFSDKYECSFVMRSGAYIIAWRR